MTKGPASSNGLILVDKPAGVTSHTVVGRVRKNLLKSFPQWDPRRQVQKARVKGGPRPPKFKCGHAGTLDPMATGLLLILVGKGSRLSSFLMGMDKSYRATIQFGEATDTLDAEGQVTNTAPVPESVDQVLEQLDLFRGDILQVPPAVSALKFEGQPLYKLVRQGKPLPELKARPVNISHLEVLDVCWEESRLDLLVHCSSGTYIRSLARDLAQAAGSEGHLSALRRLTVGPFQVENALEGVMAASGEEMGEQMLTLNQALQHVPQLRVQADEAAALRQGQQPSEEWLSRLSAQPQPMGKSGSIFRLTNEQDDLVAVGCLEPETGVPTLSAVIPAELEDNGPCD